MYYDFERGKGNHRDKSTIVPNTDIILWPILCNNVIVDLTTHLIYTAYTLYPIRSDRKGFSMKEIPSKIEKKFLELNIFPDRKRNIITITYENIESSFLDHPGNLTLQYFQSNNLKTLTSLGITAHMWFIPETCYH